MSIPKGITRQHVEQAIRQLDEGAEHPFGASIGDDLHIGGKTYPPKAVVALAAKVATGDDLSPSDFSGGESPGAILPAQRADAFRERASHPWPALWVAASTWGELWHTPILAKRGTRVPDMCCFTGARGSRARQLRLPRRRHPPALDYHHNGVKMSSSWRNCHPHILAAEIAEDLRSALEQIESVLGDLQQRAAVFNREP